MGTSIFNQENTTLESIDSFVDGAAIKRVGERNFEICKKNLDRVISVPEGAICQTILDLYNR
jgi:threonine dehydratase